MFRLMAFVLAASVLGLGSSARADEAEDKAVAFVKKLDGKVTRDEKAPGKPVVTVDLSGTQVTRAGLKELTALKGLTTLDLSRCQRVADGGLKELAALKGLTTLHLYGTQVTDGGVKELAALKGLTTLHLGDTKVTDAGVKELTALKGLTTLSLTQTQVTDAGLKELTALKGLTTLNLTRCPKVTQGGWMSSRRRCRSARSRGDRRAAVPEQLPGVQRCQIPDRAEYNVRHAPAGHKTRT